MPCTSLKQNHTFFDCIRGAPAESHKVVCRKWTGPLLPEPKMLLKLVLSISKISWLTFAVFIYVCFHIYQPINANTVQYLDWKQRKTLHLSACLGVGEGGCGLWYTCYEGSDTVERKWICTKCFFVMFDLSFSPDGRWLSGWREQGEGSAVISCFFCCTEPR